MNFLNHCTALITGASSGFGAEFARQLAPRASRLILVARRGERLEALKAELEAAFKTGEVAPAINPELAVHCYPADLSEPSEIDALLAWLTTEGLRPNLLVNNAGLGDHGRFDTAEWSRIEQMLAVNIAALTRLTHALLPVLKAQAGAAILNVSSCAAFVPMPKLAVYAATKAYVQSFSEALRMELRGSGVRVTALCPGPVQTEFGQVARRAVNPEPQDTPEWWGIPPRQVVAEGLRAVERDQARRIPGWGMAAVMGVAAVLPMVAVRMILRGRAR